jgi:SulP family sulfate permease
VLISGIVIGVLVIIVEISIGVLIFSGDLSAYVSRGIGLILFGAMISSLLYSLFSSIKGSVTLPQDTPAALLRVEIPAVAAAMAAGAGGDNLFFTVVAMISFTALLTGLLAFLLGTFNLGSLVRYLPFPVIGGFLAGTGWFLVLGGMGIMDTKVALLNPASMFVDGLWIKWLPGLVFSAVLWFMFKRFSHFLLTPTLVIAGIGAFYAGVFAFSSLPEAQAAGWFLAKLDGSGGLWQFVTLDMLAGAKWGQVFGNTLVYTSVMLISVISILLNVSGIELSLKQDVDLNRELRAAGIVNMASAAVGGATNYASIGLTGMSHTMGASSRWLGAVIAATIGAMLLFGAPLIGFLPKAILGGLTIYVGFTFLRQWLVQSFTKLPRIEYAIIWAILIAMNVIGVLEGVAVGLLLAMILFVINYSRIEVVKHALTAYNFRSNVDRPQVYDRLLYDRDNWMYILELQGFVFFGTAYRLYQQVRERIEREEPDNLRYVLLDFRQVSGLDASAVMSFPKIKQFVESHDIRLVFSNLSDALCEQMDRDFFSQVAADDRLVYKDLDHAVEWCEEQEIERLQSVGLGPSRRGEGAALSVAEERRDRLSGLLSFFEESAEDDGTTLFERMNSYLEQLEMAAGERIIQQGRRPNGLYIIHAGGATVQTENDEGKVKRLRKMSAGSVVGEVSLYMNQVATADVITNEDCVIYLLKRDRLRAMEADDPRLAQELHKYLARLLSYRLATSTDTIRALMG